MKGMGWIQPMRAALSKLWGDLRNRRYRFRQVGGAAFAIVLVVIARPVAWMYVPGVVLCGLGEMMRLWAAGYVNKSRELETRGPYSFVRHPQYLGNALIALGVALASGHLWAIPAWALFFFIFYRSAIRREDEKLHRRFGERWEEWREATPAIVPLRWPSTRGMLRLAGWSIRRCLSNGEPAWLLLVILGLVCIGLQ